jgi:tRNA 2-thiouridine synthesizing protein E
MHVTLGIQTRNEPALATLECDAEGLLLEVCGCHPDMIEVRSSDDGLVMTPQRRGLIDCTRKDFVMNIDIPEVRVLLNHLQTVWNKDKASRRYLYQLFPRGYGQQACKIAGMRKPRKLMLDV